MSQDNKIKPKNKGSKTLFQNPILERLSRTNIAIPIILFSVISVGGFIYGIVQKGLDPLIAVAVFLLGFLFFTLLEYIAHRYFFHMEPSTKIKERIQYTVHGIHHEFPKDKDRLAMPPFVALIYIATLYLVFSSFMGAMVFAFLPGVLLGYATYLFVHFIVHAYQPPKNVFKALWVHHGIHHYKDPNVAFGVSSPLWDYVFRTMPNIGNKKA